ncbi:MAG: VapB-type antitoxin [Nitrososphaerota archaeon]|jgi:virulence-associated protein VagC|nr:VapB-type antitoxin [Nitrososphaerota archaeon]MDG6961877.1 VapB-type antitoxin [Nitrososphaerota archaeon]MDG6971645.1 VapB-type antitoxin [Nitrososphaerota archaeon]MDG6973109.1 VapB-type antitoxin [Nitrososphaerota archaeon]MDG6985088.1 VapB-type antitoxin [Nitrososphaerota archaeon]
MSVVKVDAHRRVYVPKDIELDADEVVILRQGDALVLIPVPRRPIPIDVKGSIKELKARAEARARDDALERQQKRAR